MMMMMILSTAGGSPIPQATNCRRSLLVLLSFLLFTCFFSLFFRPLLPSYDQVGKDCLEIGSNPFPLICFSCGSRISSGLSGF